jgi:hypothetical protein
VTKWMDGSLVGQQKARRALAVDGAEAQHSDPAPSFRTARRANGDGRCRESPRLVKLRGTTDKTAPGKSA